MTTNSENSDTDGFASNHSESNAPTITALAAELESLRERTAALEEDLERKDERLEQLETELEHARTEADHLESKTERLESKFERTREENDRLEARVDELDRLETRVDELEDARPPQDDVEQMIEARLDAHEKKLEANKGRVGELQARELEKGAHLLEGNVDESQIDVPDGRLERISKEDGDRYFRLPESDDPLERGGSVALAHGDLLPIQQLAKMDDDMLRTTASALPTRLAAKLWKARTDPSVGDNPWKSGSAGVREYVTAGDMKHWIRRRETGISDDYAKKLVSRTIDALLDLSKNRLAITRKRQRKNGLEYTERHVLLTADAEIPGEGTKAAAEHVPVTGGVDG